MDNSSSTLLKISDIRKSFYDNIVLKGVSFELATGSVVALCGENGAGKSTLMNIINGSLKQDSGDIFFKEHHIHFQKPADAIAEGITFIPQEILFVPELTVAETVFLGRAITKNGLLNYTKMNEEALQYLKMLDLIDLSPTRKMNSLRVGEIQLIEIAKAISQNADLFIMDEPTTALTEKESNKLFKVIRVLKEKNKSIIFISHRMNEIFQIADNVLVLRDGKLVLNDQIQAVTEAKITSAMLGSELEADFQEIHQEEERGQVENQNIIKQKYLLELDSVSNHKLHNISLQLNRGEVIGIFGLMGSGRTTLLETIFGAVRIVEGHISIRQNIVKKLSPKFMINNNIGYITEDRKGSGLILGHYVLYNTILSAMNVKFSKYVKYLLTKSKLIINDVTEILDKLNLKPLLPDKVAIEYSGGNQQKIVLGKWLLNNPEVLLLDEPTKGIDVLAKSQIYKFIRDYTNSGKSIILVSSELPEIMLLSDRIIVLKSGKIVDEQKRENIFDPTKLMVSAS